MGEVYSHLSEEERQVIQIEIGNGASIRGIGAMLGRSPSSISREIKRNTWFPSNENESYRCVCSIESGPCERVDVFHVSGRFWSTSACGEKRTPARPAWTSFPS
ncbi:helix-turn-helix domain-containing protein [Bifidobacterium longum]|uniref:helix-turn-helix domain-containing protein n=2 Tax=Bifidobacterium longum TaxID=216816 RepID=UPI0005168084|nr:helix-turn-helix domain-containing protein [Bifidobacterium longum]